MGQNIKNLHHPSFNPETELLLGSPSIFLIIPGKKKKRCALLISSFFSKKRAGNNRTNGQFSEMAVLPVRAYLQVTYPIPEILLYSRDLLLNSNIAYRLKMIK